MNKKGDHFSFAFHSIQKNGVKTTAFIEVEMEVQKRYLYCVILCLILVSLSLVTN